MNHRRPLGLRFPSLFAGNFQRRDRGDTQDWVLEMPRANDQARLPDSARHVLSRWHACSHFVAVCAFELVSRQRVE